MDNDPEHDPLGMPKPNKTEEVKKQTPPVIPQSKEQKKQEISLENFNTQELVNTGRKLVRILRRREDNRLSALINADIVRKLNSQIDLLGEPISKNKPDEVVAVLDNIVKALDCIGHARTSGPLREDSESLTQVIYVLKVFGEAALSLRSQALGEEINRKLERVLLAAEEGWLLVARKRDLVRNYEGR